MTDPVLESFGQDPEFVGVQLASEITYPEETRMLNRILRSTGAELGSFSADDIMDRVGRDSFPPNLIGAVIGSWRRRGMLRVVGRERARHPQAKGRWVNRFQLTGHEGSA